jgi:ABC-type amino acid transport substrate-binding protein
LKKHLSLITLLVLLVAIVPTISACAFTTNQVTATVYGPDSAKVTDAARLADQALSQITQSTSIKVPKTIEAKKLYVGSDAAYPPLEFEAYVMAVGKDGNDAKPKATELVGFEVDLYRAVAKKLGLEPSFVRVGSVDFASALAEGRVDMVASGVVTGSALAAKLAATDAYLSADLVICTKAGTQLADAAALRGKSVGVQTGSTAQSVVQAIQGLSEARPYPHVLSAFADLKAGKVDAVAIERPVAEWILANHTDYATTLEISGSIKTDDGYAFWCKKDNQELLAAINAALAELRQAPATAQQAAATTTLGTGSPVGGSTGGATPSTTVGTTGTATAATTTTSAGTPASKSVYQLLLDKWGLTGN